MLQSKLRRRSINLDTLFVVILDALIQIYSLPLYIQRRTRFMVLKTTVRQVYILITRHTIHELISTLFNHLLNIIRMKTRRHRIPNIMVSIGILLLFLCRFQKVIKHKLHVTKSLNFSSLKLERVPKVQNSRVPTITFLAGRRELRQDCAQVTLTLT